MDLRLLVSIDRDILTDVTAKLVILTNASTQRGRKKPPCFRKTVLFVGWKTGLEPATSGTTIQRSNQTELHPPFGWANLQNFLFFQRA